MSGRPQSTAISCLGRPTLFSSALLNLLWYLEQMIPCFERDDVSEWLSEDMGTPLPVLPLEDRNLRDLNTIKQLPTWLVVMRTIVIHARRREVARTGLFGLLGDAPKQILDASDASTHATITALCGLAAEIERSAVSVTPTQDCSVPSLDQLQIKLHTVAVKCFRDEDALAHLRPAIMFCLCDRMCNHR